MRYAILSDVHANLTALDAVMRDARALKADRTVCLGDIVGYGPQPAEALARIRSACAAVLAGNHDDAVSGRRGTDDFIDLAADAVQRHREALSSEDLAWLGGLPYVFAGTDSGIAFRLVHGDLADPPAFDYIRGAEDARRNFTLPLDQNGPWQILFAGHTHNPGIFLTGGSGNVYELPPEDFTLEEGKRYIVNPGSVGYPRTNDGSCFASYVLFDAEKRSVYFRFIPFAVSSVLQRGRNPKRLGKAMLVSGFVAAAAAAAGIAFILAAGRPGTGTSAETAKAVRAVDLEKELLFRTQTLEIPDGETHLATEVRLAKGSEPLHVQIVFRDRSGRILGEQQKIVKRSWTLSKKGLKITPGTATAELRATRIKAGDACTLEVFSLAPFSSPRPKP